MSLSQSQLRLISTIGMGVLVGTSLIVIIPEGIEAVYSAGSAGHAHDRRSIGLSKVVFGARWPVEVLPTAKVVAETRALVAPRLAADIDAFNALPGPVIPDVDVTPSTPKPASGQSFNAATEDNVAPKTPTTPDTHTEQGPSHAYIGLALILGFILMYLVDKIPLHASETLQTPPTPRHISLSNLSQDLHPAHDDGDAESEGFLRSLTPTPRQTRSLATTTGLVIHAAADGIAMGASASSSNAKLGFIIFVAIMVHKAPAAFGLTSVLLKQGLSKRAARGHLVIFSLAAPVGALSTFVLVRGLGGGDGVDAVMGEWWTGMLLLFSGGTFL